MTVHPHFAPQVATAPPVDDRMALQHGDREIGVERSTGVLWCGTPTKISAGTDALWIMYNAGGELNRNWG